MVRGLFFITAASLAILSAFYDFLALSFTPPIVGLSACITTETAER